MRAFQAKCQKIPNRPIGESDRDPPGSPVQPLLIIGLLGVVLGVFLAYARPGVDWEILQTKHYWSADTWYYGGYAAQYVATPGGYRAIIAEGLCNYANMLALQEKLPAGKARHPVQGFPGTERLATPFLVYALLHAPGEASAPWAAFWQANVLLWLLSILLAHRVAALFFADGCSPWFAAALVALYPALTLTFGAVKQQPLGTIYMLFGIYLFEGHLRAAAFPLTLTAARLSLGASGGSAFRQPGAERCRCDRSGSEHAVMDAGSLHA